MFVGGFSGKKKGKGSLFKSERQARGKKRGRGESRRLHGDQEKGRVAHRCSQCPKEIGGKAEKVKSSSPNISAIGEKGGSGGLCKYSPLFPLSLLLGEGERRGR